MLAKLLVDMWILVDGLTDHIAQGNRGLFQEVPR
jgi:hypothetical protein